MLCQLLEGASYISEELLEGRGYITEVIRRKGGQTKSFSTAVCRVLLFHCFPLLHGQHAKCSIYFHIQLKPTRKMRSQVPCTNYHVWWPLHQQLTNNETSWLLWQYLPLSAQFDLQNSVPLNSVDWYTGHQKLHFSRLGLRALLAISCQRRSKEAILHWICWSYKYSLRKSL